MGSYDTLGERFGLDPDTIDALNARYGEPVDMAEQGAGGGIGGYVREQAKAAGIPTELPSLAGKEKAALAEVKKEQEAGREWSEGKRTDNIRRTGDYIPPPDANTKPVQDDGAHRMVMTDRAAAKAGINPTDDGEMEDTGASALRQGGGAGGGGAPAYVGWIPKQRQAQFGYSQEELAPMVAAEGERHEATSRRLETETAMAQQQATIDAAYAHQKAVAARNFANEFAANEQRKQRYVDGELSRLNELALKTQKEVDPDDYWKRLGTGGSFMAALSMAVGQFGAALTGGQNAAMQLIQSNIDRNIRAQEHNAAQAGKALDAATNLYAKNLEAFGDRERALVATRVNYLDHVGSELDAMLADEALPLKQRALGQKLREQIATDRAGLVGKFTQLSHTQISQADAFGSMGGGGGGAGAGKALENTVQLADGTVVQLDGAAQANEVAKTLGYHSQMQQLDQNALKLRGELDKLDPVRDRVKYQSVYRELEMAGKDRSELASQAKGQGVITKEDAKREEAVGLSYTQGFGGNVASGTFRKHIDPTAAGDREIGNNSIRSSIDRSLQAERALVTAHRGRIIRGEYQKDAAGNLKPVDRYTGQDPHPKEHRAPNGFTPMNPDARVPTRGQTLGEDTEHAPVTAAPAGSGAGGVTFNIVGGGGGRSRGGGGGKGRKRK